MSKDIRIKKGLDLKLKGEAEKTISEVTRSKVYAIKPSDFHKVTPKMVLKEGAAVKAGEVIFYSKNDEAVKFVSPVSGTIQEIVRGEKRVILEVRITADIQDVHVEHSKKNPKDLSGEEVKQHLLTSGCWSFIKQRPYDVIANSADTPKSIFVSGINSAPLQGDLDFVLKGKQEALKVGFEALTKLTSGKVHVTVSPKSDFMPSVDGVKVHKGKGLHPVGLVSTQIAKIDPINKGEKVWTVQIEDVAIIGELFLTGKFNSERIIALTGTGFKTPSYVKALIGAQISDVVSGNLKEGNYRIISGNVLTGDKKSKDDFLGYYHNQITVIPEGDDYDFFGWNIPRPNKFSVYRANMFSFLTPKKKYNLNTNTNGEHRGFVLTGEYEKVFPLDIYPMQLLKAILVKDIDQMEALGIYEVAPEDFALTEYICVSKQDHQHIVREGLDVMINEVG
ncbi:Na(+)-translocating NADH-quinone reductase subunit A [Flavobacterium sp. 316]|uniref:Na(+)-translocating NADH-quinone reductase subunit A n=1 Tax=Flavobacterium sediminilitoris TaxID=2024526 RepID=A0ABY4HNG5_9FLAO|nr:MULTISPECIES: Na(+)-translocating NADH-quinone reductase subunit A [Flavobacterium]KIX19671.1 Na(+)-translocating NADH-quinone reductase subunit A [Flavobacterium sp. 316]UOX34393.1 Na(+)-translocating NADH-quinone reductase subunit A [Flavobacterium sediminilitoris]